VAKVVSATFSALASTDPDPFRSLRKKTNAGVYISGTHGEANFLTGVNTDADAVDTATNGPLI